MPSCMVSAEAPVPHPGALTRRADHVNVRTTLRLACASMTKAAKAAPESAGDGPVVLSKSEYEKELARLQTELVRMQEWIIHEGMQVMVIFEGRDTAGKGGTIKRIIERLAAQLPRRGSGPPPSGSGRSGTSSATSRTCPRAARSCCSTAVGTTAPASRRHGLLHRGRAHRVLPHLSAARAALVRSGIIVVKYWLSLSDEEQEHRFTERINNPGSGGS